LRRACGCSRLKCALLASYARGCRARQEKRHRRYGWRVAMTTRAAARWRVGMSLLARLLPRLAPGCRCAALRTASLAPLGTAFAARHKRWRVNLSRIVTAKHLLRDDTTRASRAVIAYDAEICIA